MTSCSPTMLRGMNMKCWFEITVSWMRQTHTNPPDFHKRAVARLAHSKPSWSKAWPQASSVKDMHIIGAFKLRIGQRKSSWAIVMLNIESAHDCPIFWRRSYIQSALRLPFTGHQLGVLVLYEHCQLCPRQHGSPLTGVSVRDIYWLVVLAILNNIMQWEGLSHILWKTKNVWNHQPTNYTNPLTFFMISQLKRASLVPPPISRSLASRLSDKCPRKRMQGTTTNPPRNRGKPWKTTSKNRETETYETLL